MDCSGYRAKSRVGSGLRGDTKWKENVKSLIVMWTSGEVLTISRCTTKQKSTKHIGNMISRERVVYSYRHLGAETQCPLNARTAIEEIKIGPAHTNSVQPPDIPEIGLRSNFLVRRMEFPRI